MFGRRAGVRSLTVALRLRNRELTKASLLRFCSSKLASSEAVEVFGISDLRVYFRF